MTVAVREIEKAVGHHRRGAVRGDVLQPGRDHGVRPVRCELQREAWRAEDLQPFGERRAVEDHGAAVVRPLVGGQLAGHAIGAPFAIGDAGRQTGGDGERGRGAGAVGEAVLSQVEGERRSRRGRPSRFGDPAARPFGIGGRRRHAFLHPGAQHRLVHDAGVEALQPEIPPAQRFLQEADPRSGEGDVRIGMRPGTDEALAGGRQPGQQARDRIGVAVGPAADCVDRRGDGRVVLGHRALLPVVVAGLVADPVRQHQRIVLQAGQPHVAPAVADDLGVGRQGAECEHRRGPGDRVVEQAAAHVVAVVGIAVVGRAAGDDGLQGRRAVAGDLQGVEAAPGNAHHADRAAAPGLGGEPGDDLDRVALLLRQVFVEQQAVRIAGAAHVDADGGIAMPGEVGMHLPVAQHRSVPSPIGQVFEDGRHRALQGIDGQPKRRGEPGAVGKRDPLGRDGAYLAREGFSDGDVHGEPRRCRAASLAKISSACKPTRRWLGKSFLPGWGDQKNLPPFAYQLVPCRFL